MSDIFRTIIVEAQRVDLAREIAASFGVGGENMWVTGLSPSGLEPATDYISSGYIPIQFSNLLVDPVALYEVATSQGVVCTLDDVEDLLSSSDITDDLPFYAMDRLGVKIVQLPE